LYPAKSLSELAFRVNVADDAAGALRVKITGTVCGVFIAPVALIVIEAV